MALHCPQIYAHSHSTDRLATNIIVSSMLILGGSATVTALTGMNTVAVSNDIPRSTGAT